MATCAVHHDQTAVAFCRLCGKALCEECRRDVRGVIYCEECIAQRVAGAMPAEPGAGVQERGGPNPTLAAFLGFIPGVGAFFNGQYQKGLIHVLVFAVLVSLADRYDFFGVLIAFFLGYMVWDAYKTSESRITGKPVPDPFGLNNLFGLESNITAAPSSSGPSQPAPMEDSKAKPPIAAFVLIGLGILFLLGEISHRFVHNFWPVILIVIGLWLGVKRWNRDETC